MQYIRPRLTRVGAAPSTLAHRACAMLLERLNGSYVGEPRLEVLSGKLQPFESA